MKSYAEWKQAVAAANLTTHSFVDSENGPSPGDMYEPVFAKNATGEDVGMFCLSEDPDTIENCAVLFATPKEFDAWQYAQLQWEQENDIRGL